MAILVLVALLIFGCTRGQNYNYPVGNAAYGQQGQPSPYQGGYIGGGCAVAGPDAGPLDVSEPIAAA